MSIEFQRTREYILKMKQPYSVTFTGVDDFTDLDRLVDLSKRYPIEWGVLIGGPASKPRYPSVERINQMNALGVIHDEILCSLHLCKQHAVNAQNNHILPVEVDTSGFRRIQVNSLSYDLLRLSDFATKIDRMVIYQHRRDHFPTRTTQLPMLYPLHDESGGRGVVPKTRPAQSDSYWPVGYAGGIGLDNVVEVLNSLEAETFWIDMETKLRTEDRFDLDICEKICALIWPNR